MVPALKCACAASCPSEMREKFDASPLHSPVTTPPLAALAASHFLTAPSNSALALAEILGAAAIGCFFAAACSCLAAWIFSSDGGLGAVSFLAATSSSSPFDTGVPVVAQPTNAA